MNETSRLSTAEHRRTTSRVFLVSCILVASAIGFVAVDRRDDLFSRANALELAKQGLNRIRETRYDNVCQENFPDDLIDVDGDGMCAYEQRTYRIQQDDDLPGLKQITIKVVWPGKDEVSFDEKLQPALSDVELRLCISDIRNSSMNGEYSS